MIHIGTKPFAFWLSVPLNYEQNADVRIATTLDI
jgi:hypothetical protein